MKKKILYQCEFCRTEYNNSKDAEKCENNHRIPKKVEAGKYWPIKVRKDGYPHSVIVTFNDGTETEYFL